jgi:pteridine reductase
MSNKTALVTGGALRIGNKICKTLHADGYNIICHYNNSESAAEDLQSELNKLRKDSCKIIKFDLNNYENLEDFAFKTQQLYKSLDLLVNNASSFFETNLINHAKTDWDDLINSNLRGPFLLAKYNFEILSKNKGSIINISDAMINRGMKNYVIYSIAKAGLENLTKTLARELAPNIRVNAVAPGAILLPSDGSSQEADLINEIPLGRIGSEKDISDAVLGLTKFTYMTGQILKIDGGRSLN